MVTSAAGELVITTSSWIQASVDEKLLCAKLLSAALLVRYLGSDRQQAAEKNKQTNKRHRCNYQNPSRAALSTSSRTNCTAFVSS